MARGAGRAFTGFAKRMAARRTIAQLSELTTARWTTWASSAAKSPRAGSTGADTRRRHTSLLTALPLRLKDGLRREAPGRWTHSINRALPPTRTSRRPNC